MRTAELCELPIDAVDKTRGEVTIEGLKHGLKRSYPLFRDLKSLVREVLDSSVESQQIPVEDLSPEAVGGTFGIDRFQRADRDMTRAPCPAGDRLQ